VPVHEGRSECRFLEATIAEVQSALARRAAVRAGLWAAAAVLGATAGLLAVDGATGFAAGMRAVVYGLAAAGGAGIVAAAAMAGRARVLPPMCVARLIEQVRPDLKNALITFIELRADPAADPSICAAVGRRAARTLAEADPGDFVPAAGVGRAAWAATGAACVLGAMLWLTQGVLFGRGPAAAEAKTRDAADVARLACPAVGNVADPRHGWTSQPCHTGGTEAAETLAAALAADKEKLEKLAEALGEKPRGAGQRASGGETGRDPGVGSGSRTNEEERSSASGSANGGANEAGAGGDAGRAPGGCSEAHPNGDKKPTANGQGPGSAAGAGDKSDGASQGGISGHGPSGAGASPRTGGAKATGHEPDTGAGDSLRKSTDASTTGSTAPAVGSNAPASRPDETASGSREAGPGGGPGDGSAKPPAGHAATPPLPKQPQSEAFPEKTLDAMRKVRRIIDEADARLREGEVTDAFLGRMGMSNAEFRRFVAAWQRQLERASPEPDPGASGDVRGPAAAPAAGSAPKIEFLPAGAGTDARPVAGLAPAAAAIQGGAVQGADANVSVRLRPAVSAYFEQVGRLAAEKAGEKATP